MLKTGKKVVVVLFGGSAVELPFADQVNAILHMFLPGQNGGTATARLLYGDRRRTVPPSPAMWSTLGNGGS